MRTFGASPAPYLPHMHAETDPPASKAPSCSRLIAIHPKFFSSLVCLLGTSSSATAATESYSMSSRDITDISASGVGPTFAAAISSWFTLMLAFWSLAANPPVRAAPIYMGPSSRILVGRRSPGTGSHINAPFRLQVATPDFTPFTL